MTPFNHPSPLGQVVITANAMAKLPPADVHAALHRAGVNAGQSAPEAQENGHSFPPGFRLLSSYQAGNGTKFWMITEADRSRTLVLLPEDYAKTSLPAFSPPWFSQPNVVLIPALSVSQSGRFFKEETMDELSLYEHSMEKQKPIHEVRLGSIKAAVWHNNTTSGVRYNVTFTRLYKDKDGDQWKSTESFGRDDLLVLAKVADLTHTWICQQAQESQG
jgi:hypothetical protein